MVIQPSAPGTEYKTIATMPRANEDPGTEYIHEQTYQWRGEQITREILWSFFDYFYKTYRLFYGDIGKYFPNNSNENPAFERRFTDFIEKFVQLNANSSLGFIDIRFMFLHLKYAPIEKKMFMEFYFIRSVLGSLESGIKHHIIFYNGHFIYSSLDHNYSQLLYSYLFNTPNMDIERTLVLETNALGFFKGRFTEIDPNRFDKDICYGYMDRVSGNKESGALYGPVEVTNLLDSSDKLTYDADELFIPEIHLDGDETGHLLLLFKKKLVIGLIFEPSHLFMRQKVIEVQTALDKEAERIAPIDRLMARTLKDESHRLIYFNRMNLAYKISTNIGLRKLETEVLEYLQCNYDQHRRGHKQFTESIARVGSFWIYFHSLNGRTIYILFPGTINMAKIEEEKDTFLSQHFAHILI
eukprot:TRINITY_DN10397_c0_g1_i2.p1 TRINITY_DN10397_c0_g1~~TRINITY_DN10397_c0_g1_i2.p1  ORF type:complete len:412 (+),score=68.51 TRINITY_DN10397_c0_g1_i2:200-1435(+)